MDSKTNKKTDNETKEVLMEDIILLRDEELIEMHQSFNLLKEEITPEKSKKALKAGAAKVYRGKIAKLYYSSPTSAFILIDNKWVRLPYVSQEKHQSLVMAATEAVGSDCNTYINYDDDGVYDLYVYN